MLAEKLDDRNFKTLAYKQDEFNRIMSNLKNVFNILHLLEQYAHDFHPQNLVNFIKRLSYLLNTSDPEITKIENFKMPQPIKTQLTKLIIKHVPYMEAFDCYAVFQRVGTLQFELDDHFAKAVMQLLKYHVNDLDIGQLIKIKQNVAFLKRRKQQKEALLESNPPSQIVRRGKKPEQKLEIVDKLEKALDLAAQLKYQDVKEPRDAINVLRCFSSALSDANFEKIICKTFLYFTLL
jgi:hypothetical protein